jgi:hypothetical protein
LKRFPVFSLFPVSRLKTRETGQRGGKTAPLAGCFKPKETAAPLKQCFKT